MMRTVPLVVLILAVGCSRRAPAPVVVPVAPVTAASTAKPPPPAVEEKIAERAFKVSKDGRSRERLACWPCYLNLRDELRHSKGVRDVTVNPDPGHVIVKYERAVISDAAELVGLIEKLFKGVECTPLEEVPDFSTRIRLTREVPQPVRVAIASLTRELPVVVVKCIAPACRECMIDDPKWGPEVMRVDIDLDKTPGALAWLTPEAVPEWIALDRGGNELGRWRGRIEPRDFESKLAGIVSRGR